jgi:hypothetical protein
MKKKTEYKQISLGGAFNKDALIEFTKLVLMGKELDDAIKTINSTWATVERKNKEMLEMMKYQATPLPIFCSKANLCNFKPTKRQRAQRGAHYDLIIVDDMRDVLPTDTLLGAGTVEQAAPMQRKFNKHFSRKRKP